MRHPERGNISERVAYITATTEFPPDHRLQAALDIGASLREELAGADAPARMQRRIDKRLRDIRAWKGDREL